MRILVLTKPVPDPAARSRETADLFVPGDLLEVAPALVSELRARRGG